MPNSQTARARRNVPLRAETSVAEIRKRVTIPKIVVRPAPEG
jgi:hypothetical protein